MLLPALSGTVGGVRPIAVLRPLWFMALLSWVPFGTTRAEVDAGTVRPNILWITTEDHGPHLGCYGDTYATTPHIDAFAARSLRYEKASSNAPVCAPARTTIITGMYATSLGAQHMRCDVPGPDWLRFFPTLLRDAGYYTTNNSKTDYNVTAAGQPWDKSSRKAHWRNRPPDTPFFAVFNFTGTHESQIRNENKNPSHDPETVSVPPYHPDTPEVRKDWAQYYDRLTKADQFLQARLDELDEAGLTDETIVFFFSDHGSGMPRHKRYPGWSGLHVPMVIHVPEKYRHLAPPGYAPGARSNRLVSFVDLAPTVLSLAGIEPPNWQQGKAFMGTFRTAAPTWSFGFRGRMDERPDCRRSVTDGRYLYLRNFMPDLPHGQHVSYQFSTPTTRVWHELFEDRELTATQASFWQPPGAEELYDLKTDPHETHNLAGQPGSQSILSRFRSALREHMLSTCDLAFLPEGEIHRLSKATGRAPGSLDRAEETYPAATLFELLSAQCGEDTDWSAACSAVQPAARYWALRGFLTGTCPLTEQEEGAVLPRLEDTNPTVRIAAAEVLARRSQHEETRHRAHAVLVEGADPSHGELWYALQAWNAIDHLATLPPAMAQELRTQQDNISGVPGRARNYIPRLREHVLRQNRE